MYFSYYCSPISDRHWNHSAFWLNSCCHCHYVFFLPVGDEKMTFQFHFYEWTALVDLSSFWIKMCLGTWWRENICFVTSIFFKILYWLEDCVMGGSIILSIISPDSFYRKYFQMPKKREYFSQMLIKDSFTCLKKIDCKHVWCPLCLSDEVEQVLYQRQLSS